MHDPWTQVAEELERGEKDKGLWLRATVEAGDDATDNQIRNRYAKMRVEVLQEEAEDYEEDEAESEEEYDDEGEGEEEYDDDELCPVRKEDFFAYYSWKDAAFSYLSAESKRIKYDDYLNAFAQNSEKDLNFIKVVEATVGTNRGATSSSEDTDISSMPPFKKWINGYYSLPKTYWLLACLPNTINGWILQALVMTGNNNGVGAYALFAGIYGICSSVAVIKSANNYKGLGLWRVWAIIAAILGLLSYIGAIILFLTLMAEN